MPAWSPRFEWCLALAAALLDPALSAHLSSHAKYSDLLLTSQYSLSSKKLAINTITSFDALHHATCQPLAQAQAPRSSSRVHAACRQCALHPIGAWLQGLPVLLLAFPSPLQPAAHNQISSLLLLLHLLLLPPPPSHAHCFLHAALIKSPIIRQLTTKNHTGMVRSVWSHSFWRCKYLYMYGYKTSLYGANRMYGLSVRVI